MSITKVNTLVYEHEKFERDVAVAIEVLKAAPKSTIAIADNASFSIAMKEPSQESEEYYQAVRKEANKRIGN